MSADADRWYCLSRDGMATLCADEADAWHTAAQCDTQWRASSPHRAVRLVPADALAALVAENTAIRMLMNCYNVGGWTDALAPMQRALKAEAERDAAAAGMEAALRLEAAARRERDDLVAMCGWFERLPDGRADSQEEARFKAGQRYAAQRIRGATVDAALQPTAQEQKP
jgi:hypothetical protein